MLYKRLRDGLRLLLCAGLHHDADKRLRAGRADEHAAVFSQLGFRLLDRFAQGIRLHDGRFLLVGGQLPTSEELDGFKKILAEQRSLPRNFVRDVVMKAPSKDMMNTLSRSVLTLYSYDANADDTSLPNVLRQCLNLISVFPMLSVYGYHAYNHYIKGKSLYIHNPDPTLSVA